MLQVLGLWLNKRLFVDFIQRGRESGVGKGRQGAAYEGNEDASL